MKQVKQRTHTPSEKVGKKRSYPLQERFLRFFGDLKIFGSQPRLFFFPHLLMTAPFRITLLHDPHAYQVKGDDMRKAMAELRPGDILVRGYNHYADGHFIPGFFSHAGLYLGKVDEETIRRIWGTVFPGSTVKPGDYAPLDEVLEKALSGEQMVIHSMKDGIFMEDFLQFCRCDYMAASRLPDSVSRANDAQAPYSECETVKTTLTGEECEIAGQLKNGAAIPFDRIFPVIFKLALSQLGKDYDFSLDFASFKKMSCTEFVYYCTKSIDWCSGVRPVIEKVALVKAPGIAPDSFVGPPRLTVAFASQSVQDKGAIQKIRALYPGPYGAYSR